MKLVNGLSVGDNQGVANRMGCLACQVISYFKKGPGDFYLYPSGTRGVGEDYIYIIRPGTNGQIDLEILNAVEPDVIEKESVILT